MASTNSNSVRWVVGESTGLDGNNATASVPEAAAFGVFQATNTTVPTAAPDNGVLVHITSDDEVYFWNSTDWVGPYAQPT